MPPDSKRVSMSHRHCILGLVDETAYAGATSIATEEQHVDVEFKKEDDTEAQATAEINKARQNKLLA